jgi:cell division protein FtsB
MRKIVWSANENKWTVDRLTEEINKLKQKVAELEKREDQENAGVIALLRINRRAISHLSRLRADKFGKK